MTNPVKNSTTPRTFMVGGAAAAIGAAASRLRSGGLSDDQARLIDKVTAAGATAAASLSDIKHIVILMQENRSFDHFFGTLSGVAGFSDPNGSRRTRSPGSPPPPTGSA
jgi:phospholipase C